MRNLVLYLTILSFSTSIVQSQTFPGTTGTLSDNNCAGIFDIYTANVSGVSSTDVIENLTINISHTWVSDLNIFLLGPNGQTIEISTSNGSSGDNYTNTIFTDNATQFITTGTAPFSGSYKPEGRYNDDDVCNPVGTLGTYTFESQFWGDDPNGVWSMKIKDGSGGDIGTLNSWSITIGPQPVVAKIGINTQDPEATLDINGKLKIGDDALPPAPGMMRYSSSQNDFEGYNGTVWKSLTSSGVGNLHRINDADNNTSVDVETSANENLIRFSINGNERFTMYPTRFGFNTGDNSYFGYFAGASNTSGQFNTAFGKNTLSTNTSGSLNSSFGSSALISNTTGSNNSAFGSGALYENTTGNYNAAFGVSALSENTSAFHNSAFGGFALSLNTTGASNSAFGYEALSVNTTASFNSAFGRGALADNTIGSNNAAFGYTTLSSNLSGIANSAFGYEALASNTTAHSNSSFGAYSLSTNITGEENSAFGNQSLGYNTTGNYNSAFGKSALLNNIIGGSNSAFGWDALLNNTTGFLNSAFGTQALFNNTSGEDNSAFGANALLYNTTGSNNIAIGKYAGRFIESGGNNQTSNSSIYLGFDSRASNDGNSNEIVIGHNAIGSGSNTVTIGNNLTVSTNLRGAVGYFPIGANPGETGQIRLHELAANGQNNITIKSPDNITSSISFTLPTSTGSSGEILSTDGNGVLSWVANGGGSVNGLSHPTTGSTFEEGANNPGMTGTSNTAIGGTSMINTTDGFHNTAFGDSTLLNNTSGFSNTAVGFQALWANTTGVWNSAFGVTSLLRNTTGNDNSAFGVSALAYNTIGIDNSAFGRRALFGNTEGNFNSAFGKYALYTNTTGNYNSAFGFQTLYSNTYGSDNSAFGREALYSNIYGYANSAFGRNAMYYNTTGINNSSFGTYSLYLNTTGYDNSAFGYSALSGNTTGFYNSAFGINALGTNTTGSSNTALGDGALFHNVSGTANTAVGTISFYNGDDYSNSTAIGYAASITASDQVRLGNTNISSIGGYEPWTDLSDSRFKKAIKSDVIGIEFIKRLNPVTYQMDVQKLNQFLNIPDSLRDLGSEQLKSNTVRYGFLAQEVEEAATSLGFTFNGVDHPKNEKDHYGLRYSVFVVPLVKAVKEQQEMIENLEQENIKLKAESSQILDEVLKLRNEIQLIQAEMEKSKPLDSLPKNSSTLSNNKY